METLDVGEVERERPGVYRLRFRAPTHPMSINEARGKHWAVVRRATKPWRDAALLAALANPRLRARINGDNARHVTVHVTIPFRKGGRRDPHNYTGTVVKAVVDGLKLAAMVPDDTADYVTVDDPTLTVAADLMATVTITEESAP